MENVEIFQIVFVEGYVSITLDYDFDSPPDRVENETLVVLVLFTNPSNDGTISIESAILFFSTNYGESFYFWTIDNPFNLATLWLKSSELESYIAGANELTLVPIECSATSDTNLEIIVSAKKGKLNNIDPSNFEVQEILTMFHEELPTETSSTTSSSITVTSDQTHLTSTTLDTSTSTTESQITTGYEFYITMSVLMAVTILTIRNKHKNKEL
jgi:hypothetical protein